MSRVKTFNFIAIFFILFGCFIVGIQAQGPQPIVKLPAGMKGSNPNDPRTKLTAGVYDAGEAAFGIKHITLLKKPQAFDIGVNPDSPMVEKALKALGVPPGSQISPADKMSFAPLAFANSDIAFQGNKLFLGNFYGFNIYDISNPSNTKLLTSVICPGGQGDLSVHGNLLFMSVEMPNGRLDCSEAGFDSNPAGQERQLPVAQKDRFRGVRIFDISDISNPKQVAAVQSCRGSHTHTLVPDPKDKDNIYIYISGTSFVRQGEELAGCTDGTPDKNPETARFRIDVIKVPLASPQDAKIIASPRIFSDSATGKVNALNDGGSHENVSKEGVQRVEDTDQCHDITVYSELGLAAGACAGNGILLDIKDPANPKRIDAVNDKNYAYWHSASFSNDGKKVVFTDEWGGGMGARCRENDPNVWGANAIFALNNDKLKFGNYYKLPAAQGDSENCVAHNGSLVPVPGRDLKIQAWYQGGISLMDFTDVANPFEVAYFDRGALDPKTLILGGSWSAYWYNGSIYSSEIARGLDIFDLTPTKYLTQNEIDAAKTVQMAQLNVQSQQKNVWGNTLVIAKAYLDQLERLQTLPAAQIAKMRNAIQTAETSKNPKKLKGYVKSLEKDAKKTKKPDDMARLNALAAILKQPEM
jgi:LVIVD repeat